MIVFAAGMQRSGSTFAFNVARDLLKARGTVHQEAPSHADVAAALTRSGGADHVIIKAHKADAPTVTQARAGAIRTICTVRCVEDAVASWIETFGWTEAQTVAEFQQWLSLFERVRETSLVLNYSQIDRAPWLAAWRIARLLCPDATLTEVFRIARRHGKARVKAFADALPRDAAGVRDIGFSYYDDETYFHRRHVSSLRSRPAKARLTPDQLVRIREALAAC